MSKRKTEHLSPEENRQITSKTSRQFSPSSSNSPISQSGMEDDSLFDLPSELTRMKQLGNKLDEVANSVPKDKEFLTLDADHQRLRAFTWSASVAQSTSLAINALINSHTQMFARMMEMQRELDQLRKSSTTSVTRAVRELREQETKKNNCVLYNLPERSEAGLRNMDSDLVGEACKAVGANPATIRGVERLGRERDDPVNSPRPLKIFIDDHATKKKLITGQKKIFELPDFRGLKITTLNLNGRPKNAYIRDDLTHLQRLERQELFQHLGRMRDADDGKEYRIDWTLMEVVVDRRRVNR